MCFLGVIMIQVLYFVFCVSKPLLVCHVVCSSSKNLNQTYWDPWSCCLFFQTPLGLRGNLKYPMSMLQYYFHRTQQHDICLSNYQLNLGIKFFGPCFFWRSTNILTKTYVHFWFVTGRKEFVETICWWPVGSVGSPPKLKIFAENVWLVQMILSFWDSAYFQVLACRPLVSGRVSKKNEKCKWHKSYGAWSKNTQLTSGSCNIYSPNGKFEIAPSEFNNCMCRVLKDDSPWYLQILPITQSVESSPVVQWVTVCSQMEHRLYVLCSSVWCIVIDMFNFHDIMPSIISFCLITPLRYIIDVMCTLFITFTKLDVVS